MTRDAITFAAAGDVQLGDSAICPGFGIASRAGPRGGDELFERVAQHLSADLCIVNLETMLSSDGPRAASWDSMQMRGHREYAGALARAGVTVASVANNHAFQHGAAAFEDTILLLEEVGIAACGIAGDPPWTSRPVRLELAAASVGILAYSLRPRQFSRHVPPYAEGAPAGMLADVERLATLDEHVVVSLHWGEEFVDRPSAAEVDLGHELIEAGASLLVGHHPHVLRPVERLDRGVIAYSLGNLVSDMIWYERLRVGGILRGRLPGAGSGDRVADLELLRTRIRDDYVPEVVGEIRPPAVRDVRGLDAANYERAVSESVGAQRRRAYRYALRNLHRYPPGLFLQLARRTARNKLAALVGRA